jgi:hypothetical protein
MPKPQNLLSVTIGFRTKWHLLLNAGCWMQDVGNLKDGKLYVLQACACPGCGIITKSVIRHIKKPRINEA